VNLYPVILAGGSGTRFWPLSRQRRPKQFLPLAGEVPLLAATAARLAPLARLARTLVVCGPSHAAAVRRLLPRLPRANLVVEPCARNTAPCVGLAALHVRARDPRGMLAVLPADHHVVRPADFRRALVAGAEVAGRGLVVTVGVRPTRPETGYGYLRVGAPLPAGRAARGPLAPRRVDRFVEKPDVITAARYLAEGTYLWNAGIFLFRADVILDEIRRALPALGEQLDVLGRALGTPAWARTLRRVFPECQAISIDHGVMERSRRIAVVPGDFGWIDLGSFSALAEVRPLDDRQNVLEGEALVVDGRDNVVLGHRRRPIAVVGLDGVVAVDSGDAVLVVKRDRSQDVRQAVEELRRRGRKDVI
jgi:mannose-1-phosphate guanylyltransferase